MATLQLPQPPAGGSLGLYLARINQTLIAAFAGLVSQTDAVPRIILRSPSGTNYAVTVADDGTLSTTAV